MHCKKLLSVMIASTALLLAGCGDKDVSTRNSRVNVTPSLGLVQNALVRVYASDGQTLLGKAFTGANGMVGLSVVDGGQPAVLSVEAKADTVYFDEQLGVFVSLPAGTTMHAIVTSAYGNYGVTPLTELAYQLAVDQKLFPLTTNEVATLNERVRVALAPELNDITIPPRLVSAELQPGELGDTQAHRYALRLWVLAKLGAGQALPAVAVMDALSADVLDGVIDGLDKGGNAIATPYNADPMAPDYIVTDLNDLYASVIADPSTSIANADLRSAITGFASIDVNLDLSGLNDGSNFSGCALLAPGEFSPLPYTLEDLSINLRFEISDNTSPYADKEVVRFTFCPNGQLRLRNDYYVVADTFEKTVLDAIITQYLWKQAATGMRYEVMMQNADLYEVNVYGSDGAVYYGRFVP